VTEKQIVIEKYSDVINASFNPLVRRIYFKKFLSKRLWKLVLSKYPNVRELYFSRTAIKKCSSVFLEKLHESGFEIFIVNRDSGRPNILEKDIDIHKLSYNYVHVALQNKKRIANLRFLNIG